MKTKKINGKSNRGNRQKKRILQNSVKKKKKAGESLDGKNPMRTAQESLKKKEFRTTKLPSARIKVPPANDQKEKRNKQKGEVDPPEGNPRKAL